MKRTMLLGGIVWVRAVSQAIKTMSLLCCGSSLPAAEVTIAAPDSSRLRFALGKLESALHQRGDATQRLPHNGAAAQADIVVLTSDGLPMNPGPEGFGLARRNGCLHIAGGDERGAMYGVLDVAEQMSRAHDVAPWSVSLSHIGREADNTGELVVRYTREVVTQVLDEYPDLTGLGVTLGERMGGMTPDQRRDWLDQTFFAGIAQAKRPAKFIYRAPLSANTGSGGTTNEENDRRSRAQIESLTNNITGPVYVEFKHNWSDAHSSPDLFIVHGGTLSDAYWNPPPTRHKVVWTMRNEDMFILRWGQPDFVRDFVQRQAGKDHVGGAIIGSECYLPALDYLTKEGPHKTWRWAFERQWLFYAVWGQLLYAPATPDARFEAMLDARFGNGTGKDLLTAWKLASRVPLHFASFHRGTWDGSLYTEGFSSWVDKDEGARTFFGIDAFIKHPVLDTKRYINIADYVKTGRVPEGVMSPLELAAKLERDSATAMKRVAHLRARGGVSPVLDCELMDIEAWCAYGTYFAGKLRGGGGAGHGEGERRREATARRRGRTGEGTGTLEPPGRTWGEVQQVAGPVELERTILLDFAHPRGGKGH